MRDDELQSAARSYGAALQAHRYVLCGTAGRPALRQSGFRNAKENHMLFNRHLIAAAVLALLGSLQAAHAQQDLKPLQADVDNLKQQVSRLQADLSAAKSTKTSQTPDKPSRPDPTPTPPVSAGTGNFRLPTPRH
jgi:hypothetical protein